MWHPFRKKLKQKAIAVVATKALTPLKETRMKSWRTTAAGIATLLAVVSKVLSNDFKVEGEDVAIITGAIGLLTAKDYNATHSKP